MNDDFLDLIEELLAVEARFLIVGGYAVGAHGHPRATKDLDIWVEPTADNAARVYDALCNFGAALSDLQPTDLATPHYGFMMGLPPRRIDVLTTISGVDFAPAWSRRALLPVGRDLITPFIGLDDLIANKRAAGRLQDLADLAAVVDISGEAGDGKGRASSSDEG